MDITPQEFNSPKEVIKKYNNKTKIAHQSVM